jgi:predicted Zn-dependent protease
MRSRSVISLLLLLGLGLIAADVRAQFPRIPDRLGRIGDAAKKGKDTTDSAQVTTEQEVAIGREVAAKMVAYFKVYESPKLAAYVRKVGEAVAMQSERQDVSCHFELLDTPVVNAFAAPGGFIFVTRGLLENISTEAELAGVLAHEVGHVAGRHVVRALQRGKLLQSGVKEARAYMPGSQYLENMAGLVLERMIDRGLDPGDEYDADQRGLLYAYNAGYRPDGLGMFLETFEKIRSQSEATSSWLARTHPPAQERIQRMAESIVKRNMEIEGRALLPERFKVAMSEK